LSHAPRFLPITLTHTCLPTMLQASWYAALPAGTFGGRCGQCIRVRGLDSGASGNWHVVKVIDECASW